jgi:hypothetical protein
MHPFPPRPLPVPPAPPNPPAPCLASLFVAGTVAFTTAALRLPLLEWDELLS